MQYALSASDYSSHLNHTAFRQAAKVPTIMSHSASTRAVSKSQCQSGQSSQSPPILHSASASSNTAFHAAMNAYFDDLAAAQQRRTPSSPTPHICQGSCRGPELWLCRRCATPESIDRYLLSRQPAAIIPAAQQFSTALGGSRVVPVVTNGATAESKDGRKR
jgi:hypothetical protein